MPTRTLDITALTIDGRPLDTRQGRLMVETTEAGRRSWRASVQIRSIPQPPVDSRETDVVLTTRQRETLSGHALVTMSTSASGAGLDVWLTLVSTGDFALTG